MAGGGTPHWTATAPQTRFPALAGDLRIDVAVVGGGIAGLTTALLVKQAGLSVAVVEARRVGRQASGHSTGKLTAQHGPALSRLVRSHGSDAARAYAEANQAAVLRAVGLVAEFGIDCGLERKAACLVAGTAAGVEELEAEADCARAHGLAVDLEREAAAIPGGAAAVLRLAGQAQLNPCAYLAGLARAVDGAGSHVFEETRAMTVEPGGPGHVATDRGTVTADRIVVATQLPVVGQGLFFAKAHAYAEPMLAAAVEPGRAPRDMLLWVDEPDLSATAVPHAGETLFVAAGGRYKPGDTEAAEQAMQALEAAVTERFGAVPPRVRWTNHDYWPMDGVPFVGPVGHDGLHVATGFGAWG